MKERIKIEYFESDNDPPIEKIPSFNEIDVNIFLKTIKILNDHLQNEKEEKENDRMVQQKKTENNQPEESEYYVEGVVMKEFYEKGKSKSKEMFRREKESKCEIIKFIEKKLQVETDEIKHNYVEDVNDHPIESCPMD
jgi:hypothetical protein